MNSKERLQLIQNLPEEKRIELLKKLQLNSLKKKSIIPVMHVYPKQEYVPLSSIQEQIWFYEQVIENGCAYNIPIAMRLKGDISYEGLEYSLRIMVKRHEILRTYFEVIDGVPYQKIKDDISLDITKFYLEEEKYNLDDVFRQIGEYSKKPFDFSKCPLFRTALFFVNKQECFLVFVIHHLICDNWTLRLFMRDVVNLYKNYIDSTAYEIKEDKQNSLQYSDYCMWERELKNSSYYQENKDKLSKRLSNKEFYLQLPYDRQRENLSHWKSKSIRFEIPKDTYSKLKRFTGEEQVTTYMVLMTSYTILLYRYSRSKDIVVGTSYVSRPDTSAECILGPFINILPICLSVNGEMPVRELLQQMKETVLEYHAYRYIPIQEMVKDVKINRNDKLPSTLQIFFDFLNFDISDWTMEAPDNLTMDLYIHYDILNDDNIPKFDLDLTMWETTDAIGGNMEYTTDVFQISTVQGIIQNFLDVLDITLVSMDMTIDQLPIFLQSNDKYKQNCEEAIFNI